MRLGFVTLLLRLGFETRLLLLLLLGFETFGLLPPLSRGFVT